MLTSVNFIYIALFAAALLAAVLKKLTIPGAVAGFIVGVFVFEGGRLTGLAELATFFILGTCASSVGLLKKKLLGIAEENKGRRTMWQVLANAAVAGIIGIIGTLYFSSFSFVPYQGPRLFPLMMAGSLAAATADTLSSELGNIYGKKFYNIVTFKKDTRGLDGVISLEGTLAGMFGAMIIAIIYGFGSGDIPGATFVLFSGTIGSLVDSVLGATLERRGWLTNNWVNFLNTLAGAFTAGLLYSLFK